MHSIQLTILGEHFGSQGKVLKRRRRPCLPQHERGGDGHGSSSSCSLEFSQELSIELNASPELTNAHAWVSGVSQAKGKAPQNWFVPPMRAMRQCSMCSGISEGMGPVSWLSARPRNRRFVSFPISGGMGPVSWLSRRIRSFRAMRFPSSGGMGPVSWFPSSARFSSLTRFPSSGGMGPVSWLRERLKPFKLGNLVAFPSCGGMDVHPPSLRPNSSTSVNTVMSSQSVGQQTQMLELDCLQAMRFIDSGKVDAMDAASSSMACNAIGEKKDGCVLLCGVRG